MKTLFPSNVVCLETHGLWLFKQHEPKEQILIIKLKTDSIRCFNCEQPGHRSEECESPPMCSICQSDDHPVHECPYVPFSATNESVCSQKTSTSSLYVGAAKAPSPVALQSTLSSAFKSREDQGKRSSTEREKLRQKESTRERERTSQSTRENERAKE